METVDRLDSYPSFGQEEHAATKAFLRQQIAQYERSKMDANEDLYSDYDYDIGGFGSAPSSNPFQPKTPGGFPASRMGTASRLRTAGGTEVRPMTSTTGSGFSSKPGSSLGRPANFDPLNQGRGPAPPLAKREDNSAEDKAREYEKQVHALVEASADLALKGDADGALEKAKDAGKRERALCKHREANGLVDQINIDLTYAVCFNLAHAYHGARMHDEALHTYSLLVKNKQYPQSGRLRVSICVELFASRDLGTAALVSAQTWTRSPRDTLDRIQRAAPHADHERPQIEGRLKLDFLTVRYHSQQTMRGVIPLLSGRSTRPRWSAGGASSLAIKNANMATCP